MANELSRVAERLTRARERNWHAAARVWVPPPARREPKHAELPSELLEQRRDAGEESRRGPATLVAIHVEVRHPTGEAEPTARVIDAHVTEVDDSDDYADPAPVEETWGRSLRLAQSAKSLPASEAVFALPAQASEAGSTNKQSRPGGWLRHLVARALSAYLTQHSLVSKASAREGRMLDLRA